MNTLCLVPCGKKKIWDQNPDSGPTQARYAYIGPFARKCREYAEKFYASAWCILSARHGFLWPDDLVPGPYNVSFNDYRTNPISIEELSAQAKEKGLTGFEDIVLLGGQNYARRVKDLFPEDLIRQPLKGCKGIGYMMSRLNVALRDGIPL